MLDGLTAGLARCFSQSLRKAVLALPEQARAPHIAAWSAQDSWLRHEVGRMARVAEGVAAHEAGRVLSLIDAASTSEPA